MRRFRRHSDDHPFPAPRFPHHDYVAPFENRGRYPFRHQQYGFASDGESIDDEEGSIDAMFAGAPRYGYRDHDFMRGMRKAWPMDDIDPFEEYYPEHYESDFYDDGSPFPHHFPHQNYTHRHRHETLPRPRQNTGSWNKHNHHHQQPQHRSSHHQHHHIHHHQYIHNCAQSVNAIPGPRYGYDDGYDPSTYPVPTLPYSSNSMSSGSVGMGMGSGAILPYSRQAPRQFGSLRSPKYGCGGSDFGCAVHGGGGSIPLSGMALGPPLPSQLGIPVPRRC